MSLIRPARFRNIMEPSVSRFNPIDSSMKYIFSSNRGITLGTGVSRWDAIKGAAYLTQTDTDKQPAYNRNVYNGKPCISPDGSNDFLICNDWSASAGSHYFMFALESDFGGTFRYIFDSVTGRLTLGSQTSTQQIGWSDGTTHSVATRPMGLNLLEFLLHSGGNGQIFVNGYQIGSTLAESSYTDRAISGNTKLFSHNNGTGNFLACNITDICYQDGIPTDDTRANLLNYYALELGLSNKDIVPPVGTKKIIASDGDSLTAGFGTNVRSYIENYKKDEVFVKNFGTSGNTVTQMDATARYRIGNMISPSTVERKDFFFLGGLNDLSTDTASTTQTRIETYLERPWLNDWNRILLTLIAHSNSTRNDKIITLNEALRLADYYEGLVDLAELDEYNPNTENITEDEDYYQPDGVHQTQHGSDSVFYPATKTVYDSL